MDAADREKTIAEDCYRDGERLSASGRYVEAVAAFSRAIECNRLLGEAYFGRGACHYALRHYQQAQEDFDAATLFGCRVAQVWSRFEIKLPDEPDEMDEQPP